VSRWCYDSRGRVAVSDKDRWYDRSYAIFAQNASWKNTPDGLVMLIGFAASWVPAIPEASPTKSQAQVDSLSNAFDALAALCPRADNSSPRRYSSTRICSMRALLTRYRP